MVRTFEYKPASEEVTLSSFLAGCRTRVLSIGGKSDSLAQSKKGEGK